MGSRQGGRGMLEGLEEGTLTGGMAGLAEQQNGKSLSELEERARLIKQLTKDIHGEVESQNKFLDGMGLEMDAARRMLSGTVERFTKVFSSKTNRSFAGVVVSCVALFMLVYFLTKR